MLHGIGSTRPKEGDGGDGLPRCPKAFWIHRVGERVVLHYKEYSTDALWMPFLRDPRTNELIPKVDPVSGEILEKHQTDLQGIDLFASRVPSLTDLASLKECELCSANPGSGDEDDDDASAGSDGGGGSGGGRGGGGRGTGGTAAAQAAADAPAAAGRKAGVSGARAQVAAAPAAAGGRKSKVGAARMPAAAHSDKLEPEAGGRSKKRPPFNKKDIYESVMKLKEAMNREGERFLLAPSVPSTPPTAPSLLNLPECGHCLRRCVCRSKGLLHCDTPTGLGGVAEASADALERPA